MGLNNIIYVEAVTPLLLNSCLTRVGTIIQTKRTVDRPCKKK